MKMTAFEFERGVKWIESEGLLIALVPRPDVLQSALDLLTEKLSIRRTKRPSVGGLLLLNPSQRWNLFSDGADAGGPDFTRWARDKGLRDLRIGLGMADNDDLETAAKVRLRTFQDAVDWAKKNSPPAPASEELTDAPRRSTERMNIEALQPMLESAGLVWVNTDSEKLRKAQEAAAAAADAAAAAAVKPSQSGSALSRGPRQGRPPRATENDANVEHSKGH
jgi:hypothetical protein